MIIKAQTNFFSPITVYDTDAPKTQGGIGDKILSFFKPVVQVQLPDGTPLYSTGEWYEPTGLYWLIGFGTIVAVGAIMLMGTKSKRG